MYMYMYVYICIYSIHSADLGGLAGPAGEAAEADGALRGLFIYLLGTSFSNELLRATKLVLFLGVLDLFG